MLLWQSTQALPVGLSGVGGSLLGTLPPTCLTIDGTTSSSAEFGDGSFPTPSMNGLTPPWQFTQRGSCVKVGTILAKASIDFSLCDSESGQTAAPSLVDWARARVE